MSFVTIDKDLPAPKRRNILNWAQENYPELFNYIVGTNLDPDLSRRVHGYIIPSVTVSLPARALRPPARPVLTLARSA